MTKSTSQPLQSRVTPARQKYLETTTKTLKLLTNTRHNYTIQEIATIRKTTPRNIYYLIESYTKEGYINEQRELLQLGENLLKQALQFPPMVSNELHFTTRAHDLQFRIKILNKPANWDQHRTTITRLKKYNPRSWKIGQGTLLQELVIDNVIVRVTPKVVLIKPKDIYAEDPNEAITQAALVMESVIPLVENLFSVRLNKDRKCNITVTRQHLALIHNHIARFCLKHQIQLTVRDDTGTIRLITDNSKGLCELEAIHPQHAEDDIQEILENDLQDKILNKFYPASTTSKMIAEIALNLRGLEAQIKDLASIQANSIALQDNTVKILSSLVPNGSLGSSIEKEFNRRGYQ